MTVKTNWNFEKDVKNKEFCNFYAELFYDKKVALFLLLGYRCTTFLAPIWGFVTRSDSAASGSSSTRAAAKTACGHSRKKQYIFP